MNKEKQAGFAVPHSNWVGVGIGVGIGSGLGPGWGRGWGWVAFGLGLGQILRNQTLGIGWVVEMVHNNATLQVRTFKISVGLKFQDRAECGNKPGG